MPDIELGPDERVLLKCRAVANAYRPWRPLGEGRFWLTNERLEWKRDSLYSWLPQPGRVVLPLSDILDVTVSSALWGAYGHLLVDTATRRYVFRVSKWLWGLVPFIDVFRSGSLCREITRLIKEREILSEGDVVT